jgi:hypothetical protein
MAEAPSDPVAEIEAQLLALIQQQSPAAAFSPFAGGCGPAVYAAPSLTRPTFVDGFAFRLGAKRTHPIFRKGRRR